MRRTSLSREFFEEAGTAAMKSLTDMTLRAQRFVYFNRVTIAREIPEDQRSYGHVLESDVPEILKSYVEKGLVLEARIPHHTGHKEHVGYRANITR